MSKLPFLILSILCVVLPYKIVASSGTDNESSSVSHRRQERMGVSGFWCKGSPPARMKQNIYVVNMDNPTVVELTVNEKHIGYGLAIHPWFVVAHPSDLRAGLMVSAYDGRKLRHYVVGETEPMPGSCFQWKCNIVMIRIQPPELILLDNEHSKYNAFSKWEFKEPEIKWAREYVESYIQRVLPHPRPWRGEADRKK